MLYYWWQLQALSNIKNEPRTVIEQYQLIVFSDPLEKPGNLTLCIAG